MYLVFDIGGTNTRLGLSADGRTLKKTKIFPTPEKYSEGLAAMRDFVGLQKLRGIAGGIKGVLDHERTRLLKSSPKLQGWIKKKFKSDLENTFGCPAYLENDSAVVGLGEAVRGAGKKYGIVAYLTISTGIGGARIIKQKIDDSTFGFEPGFQIVDMNRTKCPYCGIYGHFLEHISGAALQKRYRQVPTEIKDPKVWDEIVQYLAIGLNDTIVHWSPEVVVIGGPIGAAVPIMEVKKQLRKMTKIFPKLPMLKRARLGQFGGLYGALHLLRQKLKTKQ